MFYLWLVNVGYEGGLVECGWGGFLVFDVRGVLKLLCLDFL